MIEGETGWVIQGVISKASFRRQPRGGNSSFTVMSLHINNNYAKTRGIGKKLLLTVRAVMLDEQKDLVAGDVNGAAWCRRTCVLSKKLLPTQTYLCLPAPHPCGAQGQCRVLSQTFAGFSSPQTLVNAGKYVSMVHFPFSTKLWAFAPRIKAVTMKCGYTWISFSSMVTPSREKGTSQRLLLKERSAPHQRNKERCQADEDERDRSLSSEAQATIHEHN